MRRFDGWRPRAIYAAHDDAIAESLGVLHMSFRLDHEISHHLDGFGVNELDMVLDDHALHEVLMDEFATCPPLIGILHEQDMITATDDAVANIRGWAVVVDVGLLVHEFSDQLGRGDDDGSAGADLQGEDAAVLLRPFLEPVEVGISVSRLQRCQNLAERPRACLDCGTRGLKNSL